MKRKLVMRPIAELDLIKHCIYLSERAAGSAARFRQATQASIDDIESAPRSGATLNLPSFPEVELRFRKPPGFKHYLVVYQVTDDCVFVLRILHSSQDIEAALRC
jgi:plasmid stabilization system protein ParE